MTEHLDAFERDRLARAEKTIRRGLKTFITVGTALLEIRDARLYRETHATFEDYCADRWQISKTHGNRLIQATQVMAALPDDSAPTSERQARELAPLLDDPGVMRRVWAKVMHRTGGKPTARDVREVVHETIDAPASSGASAGSAAGEGGTVPGGAVQGDPERTGGSRSGSPEDHRPEPQPASPSGEPESGGTGAPSSRSLEEGADGASPSPRPVGDGGAPADTSSGPAPIAHAGPEEAPLLTEQEIHEALTDEWSPVYLEESGCRFALVRAAAGEPVDQSVAWAIRRTARPGRLPERAKAVRS